ncbi:MAG: hypothetical protein GX045_04795 [Clostridiaceae bacterium]|nr:hypothetical protein [Clostridiaceae bacterium]
MAFSIGIIKEKSIDPDFKVSVSLYRDSILIKNSQVNLLRQPPRISFQYPEEIQKLLSREEQQKLELEILNKVAEYIIAAPSTS